MTRKSNKGFTLIELMVVIVIIGVLASLAIPRFSEASNKSKVAEAPRVLASFESGLLAAIAEVGTAVAADNVIFQAPTSKWFTYTPTYGAGAANQCVGTADKVSIGPFSGTLTTKYVPATAGTDDDDAEPDKFTRQITGIGNEQAKKWLPNYKDD